MGPVKPKLIELPELALVIRPVNPRDCSTYRHTAPAWVGQIAEVVNDYWKTFDPFGMAHQARDALAYGDTIHGTAFNYVSIKTRQRGWHRDKGDLGPGWIAYLGNFSGGEFETTGAKPVKVRPNTVVYYDPTQLHRSLPFDGQRVAVILKAKHPPHL